MQKGQCEKHVCAYQGLRVKVSISPTLDCCIVEGLCECLLNLGKPLVGSFDPSFFCHAWNV